MIGLGLPIFLVIILVGMLSKLLDLELACVLGSLFLLINYLYLPGANIRAKLDHYLNLDGALISKARFYLMPGKAFINQRQKSCVLALLFCLLFMWLPDKKIKHELSVMDDQVIKKTSQNSHQKSHDELINPDRLAVNENTALAWNLQEQQVFIEGQAAPSSDQVHFYRESWIQRIPYEWKRP